LNTIEFGSYLSLPEEWALGRKKQPPLTFSSSDRRKGSIKSSFAGNRSETFAIHFSINALTAGSFTFANDAGLIPFQKKKKPQWQLRTIM